jgi:hypothetical protein
VCYALVVSSLPPSPSPTPRQACPAAPLVHRTLDLWPAAAETNEPHEKSTIVPTAPQDGCTTLLWGGSDGWAVTNAAPARVLAVLGPQRTRVAGWCIGDTLAGPPAPLPLAVGGSAVLLGGGAAALRLPQARAQTSTSSGTLSAAAWQLWRADPPLPTATLVAATTRAFPEASAAGHVAVREPAVLSVRRGAAGFHASDLLAHLPPGTRLLPLSTPSAANSTRILAAALREERRLRDSTSQARTDAAAGRLQGAL